MNPKQSQTLAMVLGAIIVILAGAIIYTNYVKPQPTKTPTTNTPVNTNVPANTNQPATNQPAPNQDLIQVTNPKPYDTITSPVTVSGQARGSWYFEASFPVKVVDANGKVLGQSPAQAQGDWMTSEFVPFQGTVTFEKSTTETGSIIFEKDNPSGLPEFDASVTLPIRFTDVAKAGTGCVISGCSGEICASENQVSTCIFKPEFACYKTAVCEKQANGACGWTPTAELNSCLAAAKK